MEIGVRTVIKWSVHPNHKACFHILIFFHIKTVDSEGLWIIQSKENIVSEKTGCCQTKHTWRWISYTICARKKLCFFHLRQTKEMKSLRSEIAHTQSR